MKVKMVTCPCCKGEKFVVVWDSQWPGTEPQSYREQCTHCMGKGVVPAEVEEDAD